MAPFSKLLLVLAGLAGTGVLHATADDTRNHWAFQPITKPALPAVPDAAWVKTPIDAFILAKLTANGMKPSAPADRRTWMRRVHFDLLGLPPSIEDVEAFLHDKSPDAEAKLVEKLLASPHYGERWGRHWLDVARYADSNGLDENIAHGNAWRYRDYVIQAFNSDKPYDQFLREQIAGDLLPPTNEAIRREQLIATGYLVLGPKVLAEPDERKMELDIVDEQIDTLGRSVMGLTLGCARCHDHKFDPISMPDYYALAGIFTSTKTMDSFTKIAKWHEHPIGSPAEIQHQVDYDAKIVRVQNSIKVLKPKIDTDAKVEVKKLQAELAALIKAPVVGPSAMGVTEGVTADAPLLRRGNPTQPGKPVTRRFPTVLTRDIAVSLPMKQSGRLELADWLTRPEHPLPARVMANRVWRWHFGQGLVRSVDNFGLIGEKPSHPELLDWLATEFTNSNWSVKHLHRVIVLSATYRQSSLPNSTNLERDADNQLLWRFAPHRLEAEAIRDSLLAVSGQLDRTMGGPSITHVKNREFFFDHTSTDKTNYGSRRRAVYLPVVRNNIYDLFQLFDSTDGTVINGNRITTTVATQALFWMNSELVMTSADAIAKKLLAAKLDDNQRAERLLAATYLRPATASEVQRYTAAVNRFDDQLKPTEPHADKRRLRAWSLVCQVVLASNEFVTVQ